jgi:hypothetical protein
MLASLNCRQCLLPYGLRRRHHPMTKTRTRTKKTANWTHWAICLQGSDLRQCKHARSQLLSSLRPTSDIDSERSGHTSRNRSRTVTQDRLGQKQREQREAALNEHYAPISASGLFDQALQVAVPSIELDIRVYFTPPKISAGVNGNGTLLVCQHGAGYSGLSFACFAKEVGEMSKGELGVLALDARAHGKRLTCCAIINNPICAITQERRSQYRATHRNKRTLLLMSS